MNLSIRKIKKKYRTKLLFNIGCHKLGKPTAIPFLPIKAHASKGGYILFTILSQ